jgi:cell wall-associated NlpC family hydrolase
VLVTGGIRAAKVGDSVLYGPRPTFEHVATYIGGGLVFSHGSEAGPFKLSAYYRPVAMVRRHF